MKTRRNNLGDDLNIDFLEPLFGKSIIKAEYGLLPISKTYSFIGSILEYVCKQSEKVIVWGSGFKYEHNDLKESDINKNEYLAVRGPLTRDIILKAGGICPKVYGDPGILISKYVKIEIEKRYKFGLVPHKLELKSKIISELKKIEGVHIIDVTQDKSWKDTLIEINECEIILSSSLHGLIIADSYQIPNLWVRFTDYTDGGGFKYADYYGGICRSPKCLDLTKEFDVELISNELAGWMPPVVNPDFEKSCPFTIQQEPIILGTDNKK